MQSKCFLLVTALTEGGTGLLLLIGPAVLLRLLLGIEHAAVEVSVVARIAGAALIAISVACWFGRSDRSGSSQGGLLASVLLYDVAAAAILAYAGSFQSLAGIALWPAVLLHVALAIWCVVCLRKSPRGQATLNGV